MSRLTGADLIAAERARQMVGLEEGGEGYDEDHDAGHADELALAGASYAMPRDARTLTTHERVPNLWPWHAQYWKPVPGDRVRELVKAGALIAAAIDSILADRDEEARG